MVLPKLLTIVLISNLVASTLQNQFIQDDILAFPRYKIVLTKEKVSNADINMKDVQVSSNENSVIMTSAIGQPFSCVIPDVQVEQERLDREKEENAQEETEEDKQKTIEKGLELLEPLGVNCIRFFTSTHQYWAYEYCHNQYVRQFHVERTHDGKVEKEQETASFYLGLYPGVAPADIDADNRALSSAKPTSKQSQSRAPTELKSNGDQRYLLQTWKDGSKCDLTEKPRTIEVQYHCDMHGQDRVSSFVEVSTCNYQIIVSTPRLCEEMNLSHRHQAEPHQIKCRPIVSEKLIEQEREQELKNFQEQVSMKDVVTDAKEELEQEHAQEQEQVSVPQNEKPTEEQLNQDMLLGMISDLTEQINQLKLEMKSGKRIPTEFSLFTVDEQGNIVPGSDLGKLIGHQSSHKRQKQVTITTDREHQAKDQHDNKQAYHQKYIAIE